MNDEQLEALLRQLKEDTPEIRPEVVTRTIHNITNRSLRWIGLASLLLNFFTAAAVLYWLLYSVGLQTLLEAGLVLYGVLSALSLIGLIFVWDQLTPYFNPTRRIKRTGGNHA